ncbi:MAG TPA: MotA/TolQ/ExbB proton channel family protein [Phycisphaerae bacterium]|nr:MotA/TolQ/ExbB proton channel family protein [Phycisphaerae bacterium]
MLELLVQGRWFMIPLLVCSVLATAVLIDRTLAFWANRKIDTRSLRANVLKLLEEDRLADAAVLCANTPGPVSAVLLKGLQSYAKHKPLGATSEAITNIMEKAMDDFALHAMSAVEKRLSILSTIGNAAPLLGMSGTVTGMISSFAELQHGTDSAGVALGISEALITTAAGLIIALYAVIPYHVFTSSAGTIDLEIEEATSELLDFVATRVEVGR